MPRLVRSKLTCLWTAALQVNREGDDPVSLVVGQRGDELVSVPLWVKFASVRVSPKMTSLGVLVVKESLNHAGVEQHAEGFRVRIRNIRVSRFAVNEKLLALNCHSHLSHLRSQVNRRAKTDRKSNCPNRQPPLHLKSLRRFVPTAF
jgi:hypothetical protein